MLREHLVFALEESKPRCRAQPVEDDDASPELKITFECHPIHSLVLTTCTLHHHLVLYDSCPLEHGLGQDLGSSCSAHACALVFRNLNSGDEAHGKQILTAQLAHGYLLDAPTGAQVQGKDSHPVQ
jgi:hypothetical protein